MKTSYTLIDTTNRQWKYFVRGLGFVSPVITPESYLTREEEIEVLNAAIKANKHIAIIQHVSR